METVFLNSDIARMVLGYLRKQGLDKAAEMFCKTSPYLEKEYQVLKQGFRLFEFKEDLLETIIKEYCKITTKVDKAIRTMPLSVRESLQQKNLSAKLSCLIHHHTNPSTIIENKENTSSAIKRKRMSTGTTDCGDIQFANDDDIMRPPPTVSKRPRLSRGSYPNKSKNTTPKDYEILSQSEIGEIDSGDDDADADVDEPAEAFNNNAPTMHSTSTPRVQNSNSDEDLALPSIPLNSISQALLDNQEFQEKLVKNINKALQTSTFPPSTANENPIDELETVVKNATEATEIDPIFDEFLKRVVSINYSIDSSNNITGIDQPDEESQSPDQQSDNVPEQASFGSLIDPNYSISKLIVLNSNESAQKNNPSDELLTSNADGSQIINTTTLDNQMYFDHTTGQLTCPLLLTSDGLLNLPYFINSELIQQLQGDINLDTSRIEIPLPEPIILSADQMPPNAVILRSSQKVDDPPPKAMSSTAQNETVLDNRVAQPGSTPSTGILNARSFKSLSTPRKKSHVRTLSFSPMPPRNQLLKRLAPAPESSKECNTIPEEPAVIKNVDILSHKEVVPEIDSENSNSVSNQTVIHKDLNDTPKRKERSGRVKRVLSKDNEDDAEKVDVKSPLSEQTKDKSGDDEKQSNKITVSEIQLNEWKRMRETSQVNFDTYLRQENAKILNPVRSERPKKKKRKTLSPGMRKSQTSKNTRSKSQPKLAKEKTLASFKFTTKRERPKLNSNNKKEQSLATSKTLTKNKLKEDITKSVCKKIISTPNKNENEPPSPRSGKRNSKGDSSKTSTATSDDGKKVSKKVNFIQPAAIPIIKLEEEREKRTANIACLLDTPFKSISEQLLIPPTPGLAPSSLDTPCFKMIDSLRNLSETKINIIATPQFAITPGCSLTPFLKETPRSSTYQATTDYSSGGSYYRPDESDDLDKIIDKQLRDSAQKRTVEDTASGVTPNKCIELIEQKIPCESVVLSRVKSFVDEDAPKPPVNLHYTLAAGLPDLTDDEEEIRSSALSTNLSSTATSSSSSSSSSSSRQTPTPPLSGSVVKPNSISNSFANIECLSEISSTEDDDWSKDVPEKVTENSEDTLVANSQLVNNDWEVRYPVRSWLTPKKINSPKANFDERQKQLSDLELKKQRMKAKLSSDLKKPVRPVYVHDTIKARSPKKSSPQTAKSKITTIRKQYVMSTVTTKEKKVLKVMTPLKISEVDILDNSPPGPSNEQIDVLTALNLLSAKKKTPEDKNVKSPFLASKARKAQSQQKKTSPKETAKSKAKANPKAKRTTHINSTKMNQLKSSPKRTSALRQSSRCTRTPKALDDFSTASSKNMNGVATPGPKKNAKATAAAARTSKNIPNKMVMDAVVVLEPLVVPTEVEMKTEKTDCLKSSLKNLKSIDDAQHCNGSEDDDDDSEGEDDPYELCERVLIDESDSKRFKCFKYCGIDGAQPENPTSPKKCDELVLFLNPNEKHCVKTSDEFLLFSYTPKKISPSIKNIVRNIPKKRQAKVNICEDESVTDANNRILKEEVYSPDDRPSDKGASRTSLGRSDSDIGQRLNSMDGLTSKPVVPALKVSELQKAAASRDTKKTENASYSGKIMTSRSKDDKKHTPTTKHQKQLQLPLEITSKPSVKESKSSSNRFQDNNIKLSNKSSKTNATPNLDLKPTSTSHSVSSTTTNLNPVEAKTSNELPLDIDVILTKLHG